MTEFKNPFKLKYEQFRYEQLEQFEKELKCPILNVLMAKKAWVNTNDGPREFDILAISIAEKQIYFKTLDMVNMARFLSDYKKTWWLDIDWDISEAEYE